VFPAGDGVEAVMLARQFKARLVLLDIAMPRLNGLLACQAIRALPNYADVPIVMLTGYNDGRIRRAAQQVGASKFITKPFRPDALLAQLAIYLDIPAQKLPPGAASDNEDAVRFGGRAQVWTHAHDPVPVFGEGLETIKGRDAMLIHRKAERRP
jgi:CheY-like chemotaxis protein